jgi:small-conductance mechanosensitive channel
MKKIFKIAICILGLSAGPLNDVLGAEKPLSPVSLALASSLELRKTQKADLVKALNEEKKRAENGIKAIGLLLRDISTEIITAHEQLEAAKEQEIDALNKKTAVLNDRKQNLIDHQEFWRELIESHEHRITVLNDYIEFLSAKKNELKPVYSWKEFRANQIKTTEQHHKVDQCAIKKENLKKQRFALNERLNSLEQQRTVKTKERERIIIEVDKKQSKKQPSINPTVLKYEGDALAQELLFLNESIDFVRLNIDKIDTDAKALDELTELEKQRHHDLKALLAQMEARLVLDYSDVEIAHNDWKNEVQNALIIKEKLNALREPKKESKETVSSALELLRQRLTSLKTDNGKESIEIILLKAQIQLQEAKLHTIEKELALLDAKKNAAEMIATERELQFNMVEMRYRLKLETDKLDEFYVASSNKKDLAANKLRDLKEKRTLAITNLIDTNHAIDKVKNQIKGLAARRQTQNIKIRDIHIAQLLEILDETAQYLSWHLSATESYLAVNADLLGLQEKILHQYSMILHEIDHRLRTHSIWKRSPRAISYEGMVGAILEGEAFFKQLYWDTPIHLRPSSFVKLIRSWDMYDYSIILCFFMLFFMLFFVSKYLLQTIINRLIFAAQQFKGHPPYLYLHLGATFFNFLMAYFSAVFTWIFIFVHINGNFSYLDSTIKLLVSDYAIALFYLASIPLFLFLTRQFIKTLRKVNEELSYLFFAEKFQSRLVLLISIFCYATATVIPLRLALVSYTDTLQSEFSTLILAGYTLITALVIAFIFSKDDILRHIKPSSPFLVLLKRKIDTHYYPVFSFIITLFILANPYVGYSNMAWYLAFAVPGSFLLMYCLFNIHHIIRQYVIFLFMKEDDDELVAKFEHAKTYYIFFVICSFIALLFVIFLLVSRIWGFAYTPADVWKSLSEEWVVQVGIDHKIGFVDFMTMVFFIIGGFFVSSITYRFVLVRLFDILRFEPGIQNTISRIFHYSCIVIAFILGLSAIHLQQFMLYAGASFSIALGWTLKDIAADWVAGIFVLIERPIEIGNFIQIDAIKGTVHKINTRSTTIITSQNHSLIIPNRDLISKWITNWGHGRYATAFEITLRVDPTLDPEKVRRVLLSTLQANPLILKVPGTVARLEDVEENAFVFLIRAFVGARRVKEQWEIAANIRMELVRAFKEHGIIFARAERVITLHNDQGAASAIDIKFDIQK